MEKTNKKRFSQKYKMITDLWRHLCTSQRLDAILNYLNASQHIAECFLKVQLKPPEKNI